MSNLSSDDQEHSTEYLGVGETVVTRTAIAWIVSCLMEIWIGSKVCPTLLAKGIVPYDGAVDLDHLYVVT